jgi:hypothetical protein
MKSQPPSRRLELTGARPVRLWRGAGWHQLWFARPRFPPRFEAQRLAVKLNPPPEHNELRLACVHED